MTSACLKFANGMDAYRRLLDAITHAPDTLSDCLAWGPFEGRGEILENRKRVDQFVKSIFGHKSIEMPRLNAYPIYGFKVDVGGPTCGLKARILIDPSTHESWIYKRVCDYESSLPFALPRLPYTQDKTLGCSNIKITSTTLDPLQVMPHIPLPTCLGHQSTLNTVAPFINPWPMVFVAGLTILCVVALTNLKSEKMNKKPNI